MSDETSSKEAPSAGSQKKEALEFLTSIVSSACQFKASDIHIRAGHFLKKRTKWIYHSVIIKITAFV